MAHCFSLTAVPHTHLPVPISCSGSASGLWRWLQTPHLLAGPQAVLSEIGHCGWSPSSSGYPQIASGCPELFGREIPPHLDRTHPRFGRRGPRAGTYCTRWKSWGEMELLGLGWHKACTTPWAPDFYTLWTTLACIHSEGQFTFHTKQHCQHQCVIKHYTASESQILDNSYLEQMSINHILCSMRQVQHTRSNKTGFIPQ